MAKYKNLIDVGNLNIDTNTLTIDCVNNRVGVGVVDPSYNFTVKSPATGDATIAAFVNNNDGLNHVFGKDASNNGYQRMYNSSGNACVQINSGGNSYINGGNLGIGISNPSYNLDVTRDINFTGTLNQNGVSFNNVDDVASISTVFFLMGV